VNVVDVTERLMAEFEGRLGLDLVWPVVHGCRRDLDGTPVGALPELVERLARQRLIDTLEPLAGPGPHPSEVLQSS
jgi:hypothetical protein